MKAFMLVNTGLGAEKQVLQHIKKIGEVKETYAVYGVYDMLVVLEAASSKLKEIATLIRGVDNIKSTLTLLEVAEDKS